MCSPRNDDIVRVLCQYVPLAKLYRCYGITHPTELRLCLTTRPRHLDRLGQLGEFEQESNTHSAHARTTFKGTHRVLHCTGAMETRMEAHRLAMTSLLFMLDCVPEPVCQITRGKWSVRLPSATSVAACTMAPPILLSRLPCAMLTCAGSLLWVTMYTCHRSHDSSAGSACLVAPEWLCCEIVRDLNLLVSDQIPSL